MRINNDFSPPLLVNGGCPQGSLLGVFIFNISTDEIELTPSQALKESEENQINVGEFFDAADRKYLDDQNQLDASREKDADLLASSPDYASLDPFVVASPVRGSSMSDDSSSCSEIDYRFLPGVRNLPRTVIMSETESEPDDLIDNLDDVRSWSDRDLKCLKYVDDCLSLEKVCFGSTGGSGETRLIRALKTEDHFKTIESNATSRGCLLYTSPSPRD